MPDRIGPAINLKTAKALGIDIPRDAARARRRLFFERPRSATLRRSVCVHRQGELKRGTLG
jgi:hypothetical protein